MIAQPGQRVNDGLIWPDQPVGAVAGVDFTAAGGNVAAWGGQVRIFRAAAAAGLARLRRPDPDAARRIGTVAGWRAGLLDLRVEALRATTDLRSTGWHEVAAAVLGLPAQTLTDFLSGQAGSALAWPLFQRSAVVVRAGGFVGLGGAWRAPPVVAAAVPGPALLLGCADGRWWRLDADVFGTRLIPSLPPADLSGEPPPGVQIRPTSYLVRLTGEAW